MSDVKRYEPFGRDGLSSVMHEDSVGDYVRYDDHEDKRKGWIEQHARDSKELRELCQARDEARKERDQLRAQVEEQLPRLIDENHQLREEIDQYKADPSYEAACATIRALRAELAAIRGQEPVGYQFQDREGVWHGFVNEAHYIGTVKDGTWPIRAIYALPPQQPDAVSDTVRLDFMLQQDRKVIVERVPGNKLEIYVEEGVMGDEQYPAINHKGNWDGSSAEAAALKRKAIDIALLSTRQAEERE